MIPLMLSHARTLIDLIHPDPSTAAMIEITGLAPKTTPVKRHFTNVQLAAEFAIELNLARYSAFVALNPRFRMSSFEADVPYVQTMGLDLQVERTNIDAVTNALATGGILPSARGVSGNGVHMYFCVEPADPTKAKLVWERLCKYTLSDPVHNVSRIFRCPGTLNWKNPAQPKWCYLTETVAARRYTVEAIDKALDRLGAGPARQPHEGIPVPVEPPIDWLSLRKKLHPAVLDIIDTGERNAYSEKQVTRSEADWLVVCGLVRAGASDEMILWVYEKTPVGIMKYRETGFGYLDHTIKAARRATAEKRAPVVSSHNAFTPRYTGGAADARRSAKRVCW